MATFHTAEKDRILIIAIPSYNDWEALALLIDSIDSELKGVQWKVRLLVVDDGSDTELPEEQLSKARKSIDRVDVMTLRRNLGHQRAIATALAWIDANLTFEAVLVMDGDGEDSPKDISNLLDCYENTGGRTVVFAARHRRSEGLLFQTFYHLYRVVHWMLTGVTVRVGNFSVIPGSQVHRLVVVSDLWNHYAAAVVKARIPRTLVPTERARRLTGRPKMNFTALVVHGLSAISVFGDRLGVRLIVGVSVASLVTMLSLSVVILSKSLSGDVSLWEITVVAGVTIYLVLNLLMVTVLFAFSVLRSRESAEFLPARDHVWFVDDVSTLWCADDR